MNNNDAHYLSWRDKVTGPFTLEEIHQKLRRRELNSLCKIQVNGDWVLLRTFLSKATHTPAAPQQVAEEVIQPISETIPTQGASYESPSSPAIEIHIVKSGQQTGPFSREQIMSMLQSGVISDNDSSWHEGMSTWQPLKQVLNLHSSSFPKITDPLNVGKPALFGNRLGAYIIDALIVYLLLFCVYFVVTLLIGPNFLYATNGQGLILLINIISPWLYFALMESSARQATVGKLACGLMVTDMDGDRVSFGHASGRYFGKILSALILCIGYLMCLWTEQKQCLHDMMAGCLVLSKK